jgi:hypothetical protein
VNSRIEIILDYAIITLLPNGIIKVQLLSDVTIGLTESIEINKVVGELSNQKEALVLILASNTTHFTKDARDFSASYQGLKYSIAEAIVVTNLAQKILVSLYLKINKPSKPTKAFDTEELAIIWLLEIQKQSYNVA